jgi:hypothetical protein
MSNLREKMPNVTAFIDSVRETFGQDSTNSIIKRGLVGEPVFWARENGYEIGTLDMRSNPYVFIDHKDVVHFELPHWMRFAREEAIRLGVQVRPCEERSQDDAYREANELRAFMGTRKPNSGRQDETAAAVQDKAVQPGDSDGRH